MLRLPEGDYIDPDDIDFERRDDETMIINMGPQHPSTHGVLRLMLELDGETVLRTKPIIGYLHTGMEKTGEELTYVQGSTNVTRMDYLSPLHNELVFSLATEALLGVEIPPRAVWIRMLMAELNRVSSHLMWMATNGMDLGSTSMMIYGFREREMVLTFFEKTTGLRMNHNYIRPGGVAADLPDGWQDDIEVICDTILARTYEYDELLTGQPIFRERTEAVGNLSAEEALALSVTGPILRSTGVPWDLRRTMPYLAYDKLDFDVIVGTYGDNFDRYSVRLNEIRESIKMIRQIAEQMPPGDYRVQDRKVTPPPRARIDESMEALIHHFKIFTEGFRVPEGEVYVAIESPRGELGCYMVSDGTSKPYRMHIRGPSFVNLQVAAGAAARWPDGRRRRRDLLGRPGHGRGGPMSHLNADIRTRAEELVALYPEPRSALIPLCHLAQEQDGWLTPRGHERDRRAVRRHRGRGAGHRHLLRHAAHRAGGHLRGGGLHQHRLPARRRARAARARRGDARGPRRRHHARRRVHPGRGRVPGRLRPHAVRAGQPPLRRRADARELRPAGGRPARRPPGRHGPQPRHAGAGAPHRGPAGRPGRRSGRAGRHGRGAGRPAARPPPTRRGDEPDGHHRRPADRHRPPGLRGLAHAGALPGHRRLRRAAQGPDHDARGGGGRGRHGQPARAAAAPASRPVASGRCCARTR